MKKKVVKKAMVTPKKVFPQQTPAGNNQPMMKKGGKAKKC